MKMEKIKKFQASFQLVRQLVLQFMVLIVLVLTHSSILLYLEELLLSTPRKI